MTNAQCYVVLSRGIRSGDKWVERNKIQFHLYIKVIKQTKIGNIFTGNDNVAFRAYPFRRIWINKWLDTAIWWVMKKNEHIASMSIWSVSINQTCTSKFLRIRHYSKYQFCPNWKQTWLSFQHNKQELHWGKVSCINNSTPYCILQPDCCRLLCIHSIVCSLGLIVGYEMHICIQVINFHWR